MRQMRVNCIEIAKALEDRNLLVQLSHSDIGWNELCYWNQMWNAVIKYIRNYIWKRSLTRKVAANSQINVSIDSLYQKNYSLYSANRKLKSRFEV